MSVQTVCFFEDMDMNLHADFPTPDDPIKSILMVGRVSSHSMLTEYEGEMRAWR